jgi:DNA-binding MarR family transcriptional regulator
MKPDIQQIQSLNYVFERVMGKIFLAPYSTAEHNEMTGAQKRILYFLDLEGPQKMSDIARMVNTTLPAATVVVDKLVRCGILNRISDESDRRVTVVALTEHGNETMRKIKVLHETRLKEVLENLPEHKRDELVLAFTKIHALLNEIDLKDQDA